VTMDKLKLTLCQVKLQVRVLKNSLQLLNPDVKAQVMFEALSEYEKYLLNQIKETENN